MRALAAVAAVWLALLPAAFGQSAIQPVDRVVAVVNDGVVTARELEARVRNVLSGNDRTAEMAARLDRETLRRRVLEDMVLEKAIVQRAREMGIVVDESQVDRAVESVAAANRLSLPELRERLRADGIALPAFREQIRDQIAQTRLRELEVESRIQVSDADVDAFLADPANGQGGKAEYRVAQIFLRLPESPSAEQVQARRAELAQLRERTLAGEAFDALASRHSEGAEAENGGSLGWRSADQLPGLFVAAIEPLQAGGVSDIVASPAGLHLLKLEGRRGAGDAQGAVTQTRVRHILMRPGEDGRTESDVVETLERVRARIQEGTARFESMARQYSSDPSASRGGELGWVYPGDTVPEFERAMDGLAPGAVSPVVRSPFGFHLIQVLERRDTAGGAERERQRARQVLRQRRSEDAWREWLAQLRDQTYVEYRLEP